MSPGPTSQVGEAIFLGVKPAIMAIMAAAILRFGRHLLRGRLMIAIAVLAFVGAFFKVPFPIIILGAALIGFIAVLAGLQVFAGAAPASIGGLIGADEDDELADHTRPSTAQFIRSLATWLALWIAPVIVLLAVLGSASIYTQITLLFGKVALMQIGGDYAVIAYAAQQVVDSYHWISAREMQDGIAMGEMVPGTIMIVTQFLGFLAAYREPGSLPPLLAATFGGLLATWMTFLPCFLWIFVIAPFIEGLRGNTLLNGPLNAVTAAAIGMIVNLSVWFGIRTLFDDVEPLRIGWLDFDAPNMASLQPWALVLFIAASIAVFRFKLNAATTLIACSVAGATLFLLGVKG